MPCLLSAFRALQQAVPTALSSSYHPIWPLIASTSTHSSDTSWNFISPKNCPGGLKNEAPSHQFSSVAQSCPTLCHPMDCSTPGLPVHHQLPEFTQTHIPWVGDAIQQSHPLSSSSPPAFFSFCLLPPQSFPAWGFFPMSQFFTSSGQSIGASALVLPMNTQDWSPLGWTGWISLQSKGLSRVFFNTRVQKH